MIKQLHLHIGTPRTGTTSLQTILKQNAKNLEEKGFFYPNSRYSRHCELYIASKNPAEISNNLIGSNKKKDALKVYKYSNNWIKKICSEKNKFETLILSDENLSTCNKDEIRNLHSILKNKFEKITIHLTLRKHLELMISEYKQRIKWTFSTDRFQQFCKDKYKNKIFKFDEIIDDYANEFGLENISLYRYKPNPKGSNSKIFKEMGIGEIISYPDELNENSSIKSETSLNLKLELNQLVTNRYFEQGQEISFKKRLNKKFIKFIEELDPFYCSRGPRINKCEFKVDQTIIGLWSMNLEKLNKEKYKSCFK